jgi:ABC-type antimicrobial peptide transport system permease subunit
VPPLTIAGIVGDVRETDLREGPAEIVYIPLLEPAVELSIVPTTMRIAVRANAPLSSLAADIRAAISRVDPDLSVGRIETMDSIVGAARAKEGFVGTLLLTAAGVSVLLGAVGVYGSVAQVIRRRTREIGIRLALGATPAEVIRMVTAGSARAVAAGGLGGVLLSYFAVRTLRSLLFGVDAHDPAVLVLVSTIVLTSAASAALLAARRGASIAPVIALRSE